jgi:hypothetical protein
MKYIELLYEGVQIYKDGQQHSVFIKGGEILNFSK